MSESIQLNLETGRWAMLGGSILGGGGGGSETTGKQLLEHLSSFPPLFLTPLSEIDPDSIILTASLVGAPAAKQQYVSPEQMIRTVELFRRSEPETRLGGIITNENGWCATVNGWVQAAASGLPLLDAQCNGRAHPTGVMGSMNLHRDPSYVTTMTCAGGDPALGREVECVVKGSVDHTAQLIRDASIEAGGVVGVLRNPVSAAYVKENGAVGGISQAIALGQAFEEGCTVSPEKGVLAAADFLHGEIAGHGVAESFTLRTENGFDNGRCLVDGLELSFWNEYMTLTDAAGERLATFPDLIMTFDAKTGRPVTSAELREGMEIYVLHSSYRNLHLSAPMFDRELLAPIEQVVDRPILRHLDFLN